MPTFYIESVTGRKITDPAQADPTKFYVKSGTGEKIQGSQLKATPSGLPTLPPGGGSVPSPYQLPETKSTGNTLIDFKNAISAIDEMARQNRNAFIPSLASAVPEGTLNASSFGDIVQMLNRGGSKYASETAANALEAIKGPELHYVTNDAGDVTALNSTTGAIVWTAKGVGNRQDGADGKLTATELQQQINKQISGDPDYATLSAADKALYIRSLGGDPKDYLSQIELLTL